MRPLGVRRIASRHSAPMPRHDRPALRGARLPAAPAFPCSTAVLPAKAGGQPKADAMQDAGPSFRWGDERAGITITAQGAKRHPRAARSDAREIVGWDSGPFRAQGAALFARLSIRTVVISAKAGIQSKG